jgi:hypothetical protein
MHSMFEILVFSLNRFELRPQLGHRLPQGLELRGRGQSLQPGLSQEVILDGKLTLKVVDKRVVKSENKREMIFLFKNNQ